MTRRSPAARTRIASGRFVFLLTCAAAALPVACARPAADTAPDAPSPTFRDPVLAPGPIGAGQQERAALLYGRAREAMGWGRTAEVRQLATEIVEVYPASPVSGRALLLLAQAALAEGDWEVADRSAGRWADLLDPDDPRHASARLLQAEALAGAEDPAGQLDRLLRIGPAALQEERARALARTREVLPELPRSQVEAALESAPAAAVVRPAVLARVAGLYAGVGMAEDARRAASAALTSGAAGADSVLAEEILAGRDPGFRDLASGLRIATVLPEGGSPAFQDFARLIAEGVEVAAATYLGENAEVRVEALDDQGDPATAAALVRDLEGGDVVGAVGFLEEGALEAAGAERLGALPLVSPTARGVSGEGTYTLAGPDPRAAEEVARWVASSGYERVAILHSGAPESAEEAQAFESAVRGLGVPVAGVFTYAPGATFFGDEIRAAREALRAGEIRALGLGPTDTLRVMALDKVGLFLPIPAEDVELLAPQVTFYGLDTLAIDVMGTSGWTDPGTLAAVDVRHTTGVVATAPVGGEADSPGFLRFRDAYERHFRRSLTSRVPALGYDAALLLLQAAREGGATPAGIVRALDGIEGLEGATGVFSVRDGRALRETRLVRIENGALVPIG